MVVEHQVNVGDRFLALGDAHAFGRVGKMFGAGKAIAALADQNTMLLRDQEIPFGTESATFDQHGMQM